MINIENLNPFPKFCCSIGMIPTSYKVSLTYEEQLLWMCDFLENTVIPTVNNNGQAVIELQNLFVQLKSYVDNYFDNLDVQDEINNKLDEMAESGELATILEAYFHATKSVLNLDNKVNLLVGIQWLSDGWSPITNGFHHDSGNNNVLSCTVPNISNNPYVLKFTASNQYASTVEQALVVEFGNSGKFEQYQDDGTVTQYFTFYPSNGELIFTPSSNWEGDLTDIALYEIIPSQDSLQPSLKVYDQNQNVAFSTMINNKEMDNIVLSNNALQLASINAKKNIAIGNNVLNKTASAYFNVAIGYNSQHQCVNGTRNISVGYSSLADIINGDRNIALGTFALQKITNGRNNIGIGADSAWNTTTGNNNIAMSNGALNLNTSGSSNIAIGYFNSSNNTTGSQNVSLGHLANSYNQTGNHNVALGSFAHYSGVNDSHNVALGYQSMSQNSSNTDPNSYNIALGYQAMLTPNGSNNIAIGNIALKNLSNTSSFNIAIGFDTMSQNVATSAEGDNIVLGHSSGRNLQGIQNIILGRGALNSLGVNYNIAIGSSTLSATTGSSNIAIGFNAGNYISSHNNTISIGNNAHGIDRDNSIQIGNVIKYNGEYENFAFGGLDPIANAFFYLNQGTTDKVPLKIRQGVLKTVPETGGIEYDGNHLYFTNSSGVRKQLAEV